MKHSKFSVSTCRDGGLSAVAADILKSLCVTLMIVLVSGCASTASRVQAPQEPREDVQEALSAVAGALRGKPLTKEEIKGLEKQLKTDVEAQTAVQAITQSVGGNQPSVKYCPLDGKRYAPNLLTCPEHNVELEFVDP